MLNILLEKCLQVPHRETLWDTHVQYRYQHVCNELCVCVLRSNVMERMVWCAKQQQSFFQWRAIGVTGNAQVVWASKKRFVTRGCCLFEARSLRWLAGWYINPALTNLIWTHTSYSPTLFQTLTRLFLVLHLLCYTNISNIPFFGFGILMQLHNSCFVHSNFCSVTWMTFLVSWKVWRLFRQPPSWSWVHFVCLGIQMIW